VISKIEYTTHTVLETDQYIGLPLLALLNIGQYIGRSLGYLSECGSYNVQA